jgi:hypothetical protein
MQMVGLRESRPPNESAQPQGRAARSEGQLSRDLWEQNEARDLTIFGEGIN